MRARHRTHKQCVQDKKEFQSAVQAFTDAGVDAVVTLHLAYSPSLESEDAESVDCRS